MMVETKNEWHSIKVSPGLYTKLKKITEDKGCSIDEAVNSLEKVILKNFPHPTAPELIKCDACRESVIKEIKNQGYWPKPEIKEVIKVIEVPAGKVEPKPGPTKHLTYEIEHKHLR